MNGKQIHFHFLSPNTGATGLSTNQKAVAAARSEARSHAAKVSYPSEHRIQRSSTSSKVDDGRITPDQSQVGSESSQVDERSDRSFSVSATNLDSLVSDGFKGRNLKQTGPTMDWKFKQYVKKDRPKKKVPRKSLPSPTTVPKTITRSTLDPFVRPAVELSVPDKYLLHLYLSTVPDQLYGASSGEASEIIRSSSLRVLADNAIVLSWMLLIIESQVVSFQPTKHDRQLSILVRKTEAYKLMKESLNSEPRPSLDVAFNAAMAAGAEFRMENLPAAEQHVRAVKKILSLHGGAKAVRDITEPFGLMVVQILVDQGIPGLFYSCEAEFRVKFKSIVKRLHKYQVWNYSLRAESGPPSPMSVRSCLTSSSDEDERSSPNLESRVCAFSKDSALGKYVALPSTELDEPTCRFMLSVLYALNTAFWDFRNSPNASNEYLQEIKTSAELTNTANFLLRAGHFRLPSLLMLTMLAHKTATREARTASTSVVFHDEEVFEFVNLVMMGGPAIRIRVLKALLSWLTTAVSGVNDLILLNDADFEVLEQQAEDTWVADQARRLVNMQLARQQTVMGEF
ncbi:uncharacterized protein A1O9_04268 [Exophiala aquamarina CBS 119918]|uniref:Uncharacterized protein n=1 Tax=Exophiala aquamarina CBS 119918 TaxID=1182545 RepID=A0A072PH29_9EURO|nr:uncharacterized protein A1O9_04268 [Exophiala aquamarina CBS 119918]KEF59424.1 hypothetical protein A1O9_04268 [Exophiala aquamarina CBS 119918]